MFILHVHGFADPQSLTGQTDESFLPDMVLILLELFL